ncbi:unnamed protein product [Sphagnum balticum]
MAMPEVPSIIDDVLQEPLLRGRDVTGIEHLNSEELLLILDVARRLKLSKFDATQTLFAKGQTLAMLFEKPSLRTRVTFEAGMTQLGGNAIYLEGKLGLRESISDIGLNLERWVDGIMARVFDHETIVGLAANANVPVINGLSDQEHPCQAFADFQTLIEHKGTYQGQKLAYVGDSNNVSNSLMLMAATLGTDFSLACPANYQPNASIWLKAMKRAKQSGCKLVLTHDPIEAVSNADAVYTDVWTSMGQEAESEKREKAFTSFQVNTALMNHAKNNAIVLHCLPAHRGMEITAEVIDGTQSVVFDQAENRLHAQKAILALVL